MENKLNSLLTYAKAFLLLPLLFIDDACKCETQNSFPCRAFFFLFFALFKFDYNFERHIPLCATHKSLGVYNNELFRRRINIFSKRRHCVCTMEGSEWLKGKRYIIVVVIILWPKLTPAMKKIGKEINENVVKMRKFENIVMIFFFFNVTPPNHPVSIIFRCNYRESADGRDVNAKEGHWSAVKSQWNVYL